MRVAAAWSGLKAFGLQVDADQTGGRPKCMSGQQLARTGTRRQKRRLLGHAASRKVHPRAERRRKLLPRPVRPGVARRLMPDPLRCRCETADGRPYAKPWRGVRYAGARMSRPGEGLANGRRGRGFSPSRSARLSFGAQKEHLSWREWGKPQAR